MGILIFKKIRKKSMSNYKKVFIKNAIKKLKHTEKGTGSWKKLMLIIFNGVLGDAKY